jgi:hypothetical protein
MDPTNPPRERSITILHLHLHTHRTKHILQVLHANSHVINRSINSIHNYSNSFHRLCPTMRANIILRGNSNYKSTISNPIRRNGFGPMSMRWLCCRQRNINPILYTSLFSTIYYHSHSDNSCTRTRDLPACSIAPQPTSLPRATSAWYMNYYYCKI